MTKPSVPSSLSYQRSIEPTEFGMYAVYPKGGYAGVADLDTLADLVPVPVRTTTVRGTIFNYERGKTAEQRIGSGEKSLDAPNIQTVEVASLPADTGLLAVTGAVRFAPHSRRPMMCDKQEFVEALCRFTEVFAQKGGYRTLAVRYVLNLANGSWMWRNRFGDDIEVRLSAGGTSVTFKEPDIQMTRGYTQDAITDAARQGAFITIVDLVADALAGNKGPLATLRVDVSAVVNAGNGAEVYPSQEFSGEDTRATNGKGLGDVRKILARGRSKACANQAVLHARKVGNAIRTIDTWYRGAVAPIAVEPFGVNTHMAIAHRRFGDDLYAYLARPDKMLASLEKADGPEPEHLFMVACLIRAGVFGFGKKDKEKAETESGLGDTSNAEVA